MEPTEHNRRAWEERQRRRSASEPAAQPASVPEPTYAEANTSSEEE